MHGLISEYDVVATASLNDVSVLPRIGNLVKMRSMCPRTRIHGVSADLTIEQLVLHELRGTSPNANNGLGRSPLKGSCCVKNPSGSAFRPPDGVVV